MSGSSASHRKLETLRALVVDDDPVVCQVHAALLRQQGLEPIVASNGLEAMSALRSHWPLQLALIDWHMAPLNGYAFAAAIRADPDFAGLRLIMITSEERPERIDQAYAIGVDAVLGKPLQLDTLLGALDEAEQRRPRRAKPPTSRRLSAPSQREVAAAILNHRGLQLGQHLGDGGMADIFAVLGAVGAPQALKISSRALAEDEVLARRFGREGRLLRTLDHPNVLRVTDAGVEQGYPYLLMERLEGNLLQHMQACGGRISPSIAHRLISACAQGLRAVHAAGYVHRDLKPANILLRHDGSPVIIDFNLAVSQRDLTRLTQSGKVLGTPAYMAPEAVLGKSTRPESLDIYSLGATWFHCLTGSPPFEQDTVWETFKHIVHHPLPDLEALLPDCSPAQRRLLASCLAKTPEQRPQDVSELIRNLASC